MSVTRHLDLKSSIISAELKNISPHDRYDGFIDLLATANYIMPSNRIMTDQAIDLSLLMNPIVVIRLKKAQDHYLCIGGIRSLMLAKASLPLDEILSVTLVDNLRFEEIALVVNADIFISPLLMSIRSPATIGAIHQKMSKEDIKKLLIKDMDNKSKFSAEISFAKNTVFPPKGSATVETGGTS